MLLANDEEYPGFGDEVGQSVDGPLGVAPTRGGISTEAFVRDDHGRTPIRGPGDLLLHLLAQKLPVETEESPGYPRWNHHW